ncbi:hypothetical protein KI387_021554, partial [Taxus chinensis]
ALQEHIHPYYAPSTVYESGGKKKVWYAMNHRHSEVERLYEVATWTKFRSGFPPEEGQNDLAVFRCVFCLQATVFAERFAAITISSLAQKPIYSM